MNLSNKELTMFWAQERDCWVVERGRIGDYSAGPSFEPGFQTEGESREYFLLLRYSTFVPGDIPDTPEISSQLGR